MMIHLTRPVRVGHMVEFISFQERHPGTLQGRIHAALHTRERRRAWEKQNPSARLLRKFQTITEDHDGEYITCVTLCIYEVPMPHPAGAAEE